MSFFINLSDIGTSLGGGREGFFFGGGGVFVAKLLRDGLEFPNAILLDEYK